MDCNSMVDDLGGSFESDSIQWQGSQTACAALDSLLSEAAFRPQSDYSNGISRSSGNNAKGPLNHSRSSSHLSSSSSSFLSRSLGESSGQSRHIPSDATSARTSSSSTAPNWHTRQSRPASSQAGLLPMTDPGQFLSMLKGISERIDSNIRNDASTSRDIPKRKQPKRIASSSGVAKRARHNIPQGAASRSFSENSGKGTRQGLEGIPRSSSHAEGPGENACVSSESLMEVDPPAPSCEVMPPPPVPLQKIKPRPPVVQAPQTRLPPPPAISKGQTRNQTITPAPTHQQRQSQAPSQSRDSISPSQCSQTPSSTPKLHPLLDPERKKRRLKLERTISASLSSTPAASPTPDSPSEINPSPVPPVHQRQQPRAQPTQSNPGALPLSQGRVGNNSSRAPPLGMRRTHTFPSTTHTTTSSRSEQKTPLPKKQGSFRSPLLPSSQPSSASSTTSSSRSTVPSSERSFTPTKTLPPTSTETPSSQSGDENMDDLPQSSEADISFGDALPLDVDMDALEETMRKYD